MLLGRSKVDITPTDPIQLAGFAHRTQQATKVAQKLYVKTFMLQNDGKIILIIVADLIWWDDKFVSRLQNVITNKFQIPKNQICFHATHNHSGPQTSSKFSQQLGKLSKFYLSFIKECVLLGITEAKKDKEKVSMEIRKGSSNINIYRRKKVDDNIKMLPNSAIRTDNELTVITFNTLENKKKSVWIHYSCHPTTTDENILSSEFTGVCCERIENMYPDATVAYLQGFCGDLRPNLVQEKKFYRGKVEDTVRIGEQFANEVLQIIKKSKKVTAKGSFTCKRIVLTMRFSDKNKQHLVPASLEVEWSQLVKKNLSDGYELIFQYIQLSDQISFMACNAELVQAYSFFIKKLKKNLLPLGYSNGMVGYIPTSEQLKEGGYEAVQSLFYFGYPSTMETEMEDEIKQTFRTILGGKD